MHVIAPKMIPRLTSMENMERGLTSMTQMSAAMTTVMIKAGNSLKNGQALRRMRTRSSTDGGATHVFT